MHVIGKLILDKRDTIPGRTSLFINMLKIYTKDQYIFLNILDEKAISEVYCHQQIISWILNIKLAT